MGVSIIGSQYVQDGEEYFAVLDPKDPFLGMLEVGYSTGSQTRSYPIITASSLIASNSALVPILAESSDDIPGYTGEAFTRGKLEVFLMGLFFASVSFDDNDEATTLNLQDGGGEFVSPNSMQGAGRLSIYEDSAASTATSDFDALNLADFCALTGARERRYLEQSTGLTKDIFTLGPGVDRPTPSEVAQTAAGNTKMLSTIRHLGIPGLLKHLYAADWISLDELGTEIQKACPDQSERETHVSNMIIPFLRSKGSPILTKKEIQTAFSL